MLKRTKGRILLTLLVVTGFAGTVNNTALTKEDRKLAIEHLKDTKANLQKSIKGLTEAQLNFKDSPSARSIRDCFVHLADTETAYWDMLDLVMKEPARPEQRSGLAFSDEDFLHGGSGTKAGMCFQSQHLNWENFDDAQSSFKKLRTQYLRYVKTTTEDLRNHVIKLPFGPIDCYQFILFISAHSDKHLQEIQAIMSHPTFPGKSVDK